MFRTSAKKALAVFLSAVLLVSCIAVSGIYVGASTVVIENSFTSEGTKTYFDTIYQGKYSNLASPLDNAGLLGVEYKPTDDGANGTKGLVKMFFADGSNGSGVGCIGMRFVPESGSSYKAVVGTCYRVSFYYKVEALPAGATAHFYIRNTSIPWGQPPTDTGVAKDGVEIASITETTGWVKAETSFVGTVDNGIHLQFQPDDKANRAGTTVLVDDVKVEILEGDELARVSFDSDGGSMVSTIYGLPGKPITYPAAPTRDGYRFDKWEKVGGGEAPTTFAAGETKLKAKWITAYGITFDSAGGSVVKTIYGLPGEDVVLPADPVREGYRFMGWQTVAGGAAPTKFTAENITLVAQWKECYTVTFNSNGGSKVDPVEGFTGEDIPYPATAPTRSGYDFKGWKLGSDPAPTKFGTSNITVTAQWQIKANASRMVFNTMGGTELGELMGEKGDVIHVAPPTKEGFTFDGWFADYDCTTPISVFPDVTGNVTVYAGWTPATGHVQTYETVSGTGPAAPFLTSGFESAGVKATDNDSQLSGYYLNEGAGNNTWAAKGAYAEYKPSYGSDAHTGTGVMELRFTDEDTGTNAAVFSIAKIEEPKTFAPPKKGTTYKVSFWYKVLALTGETTLDFTYARHNLSNKTDPSGVKVTAETLIPGKVDLNVWKQASVTFTTDPNNQTDYMYLSAKATTSAARAGTKILFDDVEVSEGGYVSLTASGTVEVNSSATNARNSSKSVKFTAKNNTNETSRVVYADGGADMKLATGQRYIVNCWVMSKVDLPATANVVARVFDETAGTQLAEAPVSMNKNTWTRLQFNVDVPGDGEAHFFSIGFAVNANTGANRVIYMDDLLMTEFVDPKVVQDYEKFEAKTYSNTAKVDGTIHGNAGGVTVVDTFNRTVGGNKALKLTMASDAEDSYARTVLQLVGAGDLQGNKGDSYMITFYAYSETDRTVTFALGNSEKVDLSDPATVKNIISKSSVSTVDLKAGEWTLVSIKARMAAVRYVTLGGWFEGASNSNQGVVYIDDVFKYDYVEPDITSSVLCFESTNPGDKFGQATDATGNIVVSPEQNRTKGGYVSAKFINNDNVPTHLAQMTVLNGDMDPVPVTKGENYRLTFHAYIPTSVNSNLLDYWIAIVDDPEAPAITDAAALEKAVVAQGTIEATPGAWKKVIIEMPDISASGYLRFAASAALDEGSILFADDFAVKTYRIFVPDPNAKVQSFETYDVDDNSMIMKNVGEVSEDYDHSTGSGKSLRLHTKSWAGADRNQWVLTDPANNNQWMEVKVGEAYQLSFWVYLPEDEGDSMGFNYWVMSTDTPSSSLVKAGADKNAAEYDMGGSTTNIDAGEWTEITQTITIKNGKYLMFGTSDNTEMNAKTTYYIDDVSLTVPRFIHVTYDANGGMDGETNGAWSKSKYTFEVPAGGLLNVDKYQPAYDPYKDGYDLIGWFRDADCSDKFEMTSDQTPDKDFTLYAGWKKHIRTRPADPEEENKEEPIEYETIYETERVYTGAADMEERFIEGGVRPTMEESDAVQVDTTKREKKKKDATDEGIPAWLIIVIAAGAVVVIGGGAALFVVLRKKSNKAKEVDG